MFEAMPLVLLYGTAESHDLRRGSLRKHIVEVIEGINSDRLQHCIQ